MAISEPYTLSAVSISTTEISIVSGTSSLASDTSDGVFQLYLDPVAAALAKGDEFEVKIYEKVLSGSTKRVVFQQVIADAQGEIWVSPTLILLHGWDMTLKKLAGTDRNWTASIRKVA